MKTSSPNMYFQEESDLVLKEGFKVQDMLKQLMCEKSILPIEFYCT